MSRWMAAATVALAAAWTVGCGNQQKQTAPDNGLVSAAKAEPVQLLEQTQGSNEALTDGGVHLVKDQAGLEALGVQEIEGLNPNWDQQDLVLLALGEQNTEGYWAQITGIQQVGDVLYVQATVNQPGQDAMVPQVITYPYAAALVPNTDAQRAQGDFDEVTGQSLERLDAEAGEAASGE